MAKRQMSGKKALAIFTPCITAVVAIMLAIVIAASMFGEDISLYLYGVIWYRFVLTMVILLGVVILLVLATLFKEVVKDGKEYYTDSSLSV